MECDQAFQGVPHICAICGVDQQQPAHLHVDDAQFRHYRALMGWHAGFISVQAQIPEG